MFKLHDRVKETSYTQGTGNLILREAVNGFRTFSSVYSDADTFFYCITNNSNYEIGLGRYVASGNEISRVELFDSSTGSLINWGQGLKEIYVTYAATKSVTKRNDTEVNPASGDLAVWFGGELGSISGVGYDLSNSTMIIPDLQSDTVTPGILEMESGAIQSWNNGAETVNQTKASVDISLDTLTGIDDVIGSSGYAGHTLGLYKQGPGTVFAGPLNNCSGEPCEDAYPYFRPLTSDDLPSIDAQNVDYSPSDSGNWDTLPTNNQQALDYLAVRSDLYLEKEDNLSSLTNKALARTNLELGSAAQSALTDFSPSGHIHSFTAVDSGVSPLTTGTYSIRNSGDDIYLYVNIAGTVKTLQLGTVT